MGPFLDLKNSAVTSSSESFSTQWIKMVKTIAARVAELSTKVLIGKWKWEVVSCHLYQYYGECCVPVTSSRDAVSYPVYPQPPFPGSDSYSANMKTISDPAILDIGGINVALTSTDILFHLGKEEISFPPRSGDRMSRLASHLLQQGSMYPLYPPSEDLNLDLERVEQHALLEASPHLLLLPSDLATFVREVGATTVLNPGRLTKGAGPGTYSLLKVRRGEGGGLETRAEIIRI